MTMQEAMTALGLSVSAVFVPWSKSRNFDPKAGPDKRSLNWRVTVHHAAPQAGERGIGAREVLTTDYGAGIAHCPSYKQGASWTVDYAAAIEHETETGKAALAFVRPQGALLGRALMPDAADVLASLAMDAGAIDSATYEEWAGDYGYDPDSRKGEAIYRACLETALKLRAALGDAGLQTLRDAAADH